MTHENAVARLIGDHMARTVIEGFGPLLKELERLEGCARRRAAQGGTDLAALLDEAARVRAGLDAAWRRDVLQLVGISERVLEERDAQEETAERAAEQEAAT